MDQPLTVDQANELEGLIDRHGIENVLRVISMICGEKAAHVESNWQDKMLAKRWSQVGRALDNVAACCDRM